MMKKISNIVFDFGGVLVDLDKSVALANFRKIGVDAAPYIDAYAQRGAFADFELGLISEADFCSEVRKLSDLNEVSDEAIKAAWNSMLLTIPRFKLEWILEHKDEYNIHLLSNTNATHWERAIKELFCFDNHRVEDFFQKIFLSFELNEAKPGKEIFETMLRTTGITPEATLFIDDSKANCQTAESLGINTYCPSPHEDWRGNIENLLERK